MATLFTLSAEIACLYTVLITVQIYLCVCVNFTQSTMPVALWSFAIGYDATNDTILLLGGEHTERQLTLFQIQNNTFVSRGSTFLPSAHATYSLSQHYTQLNDQLWMLDSNGEKFIRMDLKSYTSYSPSTTLPISVDQYGCLTSSDDHLIVIRRQVQIYNINDNQWLSNVPTLQQPRGHLACAVVNKHVYAIGGYTNVQGSGLILDTIEVLDLSNMSLDSFSSWYDFSDTLTVQRTGSRSVVHGRDIYVVGGCTTIKCIGSGTTTVGIIDTVTGQYNDIDDSLAYGVVVAPSIIVRDTLYVFGGLSRSLYQYMKLPTPWPNTTMQTNYTSIISTHSPTNYTSSEERSHVEPWPWHISMLAI
eukprot:932123_1